MLRTALLGGNTITLDADLSKYIETLSEQGIIEGLEVSSNSIAPGKAWVKATRSNGETIMVLVQNTEALSVDTTGTKKIWIEIKQEAIDNGGLNNEDGTGIASIKTGPSVPSQNSLLLASVADGQIKDERNLIPKIQSVAQRTSLLEQQGAQSAALLDQIEEGISADHIGFSLRAGENIQVNDIVFAQKLRDKSEYTIDVKIGYSSDESAPQIQLISNGKAINYIDLKLSKVGDPTYGLICTLYEAEEISGAIPAWKQKGVVLATGQVGEITTTAEVVRITFANPIQRPKGTKLVAVIDTVGSARSTVNYYQLWCHTQQFSEIIRFGYQTATSFVSKNLMPYLDGEGFYTGFLVKNEETKKVEIPRNQEVKKITQNPFRRINQSNPLEFDIYEFEEDGRYELFMDYTDNYNTPTYYLNIHNSGLKDVGWGDRRQEYNTYRTVFLAKKGQKLRFKSSYWNAGNNMQFRSITITQKGKTISKYDTLTALARGNYLFGTVAEATVVGLHSNNQRRGLPKKSIRISKSLVGSASGARNAPSDGLLEVSRSITYDKWTDRAGNCSINSKPLGYTQNHNTPITIGYGWFYVPKGTVSFSTYVNHSNVAASMTIHSFISL